MKVTDNGTFAIYVYYEKGSPHHLPHCHVRWKHMETVVTLPSLQIIAGPLLPKEAKRLLSENLEEIANAWDKLN